MSGVHEVQMNGLSGILAITSVTSAIDATLVECYTCSILKGRGDYPLVGLGLWPSKGSGCLEHPDPLESHSKQGPLVSIIALTKV